MLMDGEKSKMQKDSVNAEMTAEFVVFLYFPNVAFK